MVDLGTLLIGVKVDKDGAIRNLNDVSGTVSEKENAINKSMANIGKSIIAAFSVAAIVNFTKKIVEASADVQAMDAQFDQVFKGDTENAMIAINEQADLLGIHADRLTTSFNKFGGQVKGAGMDSKAALEATTKATSLAADAAAFYDTSLEEASASVASFMKGNFEAGDAIGVFTNAKQMDIKSNEMYGKSWADLTEAERQYLLLDTVSKTYELNGAMGQAQRESGSYSNVLGNLQATFTRLYSVIGEPVLNVFLQILTKVTDAAENFTTKLQENDTITKLFTDAITFLKENMDIILPVIEGVTAAIAAQAIINSISSGYAAFKLATEGTTIAQAALNAIMAANPFGLLAIAIAALVVAGVELYKNWDTVKAKAEELAKKIKSVFTGMATEAREWGENIVKGIWYGMDVLKDWITNKVKSFAKNIADTVTNFFKIKSPSQLMAGYGRNISEGLAKGIEENADLAINAMKEINGGIDTAVYMNNLQQTERAATQDANNSSMSAEIVNGLAAILGGNNPKKPQPVEVVLKIDGKQFARATYDELQNESVRRGTEA